MSSLTLRGVIGADGGIQLESLCVLPPGTSVEVTIRPVASEPVSGDQDPKKFETRSGLFVGLLDHPIDVDVDVDVDGILAEMNTEWQSKLGDLQP